MQEKQTWTYIFLSLGIFIVCFPVYLAFVASTHPLEAISGQTIPFFPGPLLIENYTKALTGDFAAVGGMKIARNLLNTTVMAVLIAVGKISISIIAAYAIVFFRFPLRKVFFWMIFLTLMLPVEVRIVPTFKVVADFNMLDSYAGLVIPLIASATATFLFRQFYMTVPPELVEAAKIDGAGPVKFFKDIILPLSRTNIAALFVIMFIYGWNQYLWPLLITNDDSMYTIVISLQRMLAVGDAAVEWNLVMATLILALIPPILVVLMMQKLFVKGLVETEK